VLNLFYVHCWIVSAISFTAAASVMAVYMNLKYTLPYGETQLTSVVERVFNSVLPFLGTISLIVACHVNEYNIRRMFFVLDKFRHVLKFSHLKSKAGLKRLLQSLPDGVVIHAGTQLVYWNDTMENMIQDIDPAYRARQRELAKPADKTERRELFSERVRFAC
jgi:hypothetical protein